MVNAQSGIYHYCGHQEVSWSYFAKQIVNVYFVKGGLLLQNNIPRWLKDKYIQCLMQKLLIY